MGFILQKQNKTNILFLYTRGSNWKIDSRYMKMRVNY